MSLEMCDICDQPTGGAGRHDDSLVCANCNKVICGGCQAEFDEIVICKPCAAKAFGIPLDRLETICAAELADRCVMLPEGYDHSKEFWHVVSAPLLCDEDGGGCENCPYELPDDCTFKPHVEEVTPLDVYKALHTLYGLRLTRDEAEAAMKEDAQ